MTLQLTEPSGLGALSNLKVKLSRSYSPAQYPSRSLNAYRIKSRFLSFFLYDMGPAPLHGILPSLLLTQAILPCWSCSKCPLYFPAPQPFLRLFPLLEYPASHLWLVNLTQPLRPSPIPSPFQSSSQLWSPIAQPATSTVE